MEEGVIVRFNKRRKTHRRREGEEDEDERHGASSVATALPEAIADGRQKSPTNKGEMEETHSPPHEPDLPADISVAELLRRRKQAKARRGGIEFSNSPSAGDSNSGAGRHSLALGAVLSVEDTPNVVELAQSRFAPQTGTVTESSNQHMMAFIDSEMARLRAGVSSAAASSDPASQNPTSNGAPLNLPDRQPAALGQIQEIDLGPDAVMRNIAMTEAATRRLQTGQPFGTDETSLPPKVRLGRNGKPRRPRKRRASDDIKRDEVVEAVLRENRLELYDETGNKQPGNTTAGGAVDAADDIIAEQFQRDFLEAIQSRNRMRKPPAQPAAGKKGPLDEKSRGPKLGGSRSARAAMHAAEKAKTGKK